MTKADRIRKLAKQGKSDAEIARIVAKEFGSCAQSYVRTCARQRVNGQSDADRRYENSQLGRQRDKRSREAFKAKYGCSRHGLQYRTDPEFRVRSLARSREWQRKNWERHLEQARECMRRLRRRRKAEASAHA
jgi:hypothetical protein